MFVKWWKYIIYKPLTTRAVIIWEKCFIYGTFYYEYHGSENWFIDLMENNFNGVLASNDQVRWK